MLNCEGQREAHKRQRYCKDLKGTRGYPVSDVFSSFALLDFCTSELLHYIFYSSTMGRFIRPDNILGDLNNPQSFNRYSYVKGNPVNMYDPTGHAEAEPDQQLAIVGNGTNQNLPTADRSISPPTNENQEMKKKLTEDQPKKVGDELFKLTLDVSGLAAIATDKAANPTITQSSAKAAEDWGLMLKQPEFKVAGKILGGISAVIDIYGAGKNIFEERSAGTKLTAEERKDIYKDIALNTVILGGSLLLEGVSITASSILAVPSALKLGTDIGKLYNSDFEMAPSNIPPGEIPKQHWPSLFY